LENICVIAGEGWSELSFIIDDFSVISLIMYLARVDLHDSWNKIEYSFLIYDKTLTWTK
jgi:hypothetical protein